MDNEKKSEFITYMAENPSVAAFFVFLFFVVLGLFAVISPIKDFNPLGIWAGMITGLLSVGFFVVLAGFIHIIQYCIYKIRQH